MNKLRTSLPFLASFLATGLLAAPLAFAAVASSTNYQIGEDSINFGGGLATSTSYQVEDTYGESGVGTSSSASYNLKAGYQQLSQSYLAVSVPGNISLAPVVPSVGGGTANGSGVWTITTDDSAGYSATLNSSNAPALTSGANNFADYVTGGANPDFTFSTPAAASRFGFTPEGSDIVQRYKDDGASCNTGALDTGSACWDKLSTTSVAILGRTSANYPSGTATTIRFRASSGASNVQPGGSYTATATLTVIAN